MTTPEKSGRQLNEKPYTITSNSMSYEIKIPNMRKKISLRIFPGGVSTTMIEDLNPLTENQLKTENQFREVTRNLIVEGARNKANQSLPGEKDIGLEMSAGSLMDDFGKMIKDFRKKGYTAEQLKQTVLEQAKLIDIGRKHLGEMPEPVKEQVIIIDSRIDEYFENMRQAKEKNIKSH